MNRVRAGFFSFTEVLDGAHRAYNEWHQLDHMPEQFAIPGLVHGQRWVETPRCRAARALSDERLTAAQYVTLYLMAEPLATTIAEFVHLGGELHARGRWFEPRRALASGPLMRIDAVAAARVRVAAEVVPWRPHRGVVVAVSEVVDPAGLGPYRAAVEGRHRRVVEQPGVAGLWTFARHPSIAARHPFPIDARITVVWCDDDPVAVLARLVDAARSDPVAPDGAVRLVHVAAYETVTPWEWGWFDGTAAHPAGAGGPDDAGGGDPDGPRAGSQPS